MDRDLKFQMNFMVSVTLLLVFLHISEANDGCGAKPKFELCPDPSLHYYYPPCYCPDGSRIKFKTCDNGLWRALPCGCDAPLKYPWQTIMSKPGSINNETGQYKLGSIVKYICNTTRIEVVQAKCESGRWNNLPVRHNPNACVPKGTSTTAKVTAPGCDAPLKYPWQTIMSKPGSINNETGQYKLGSIVKYICNTTRIEVGQAKCESGKWNNSPVRHNPNACVPKGTSTTAKATAPVPTQKTKSRKPTILILKPKVTDSSIHHTEERTVVIVSGTTGAILSALIILVVIVSCQRRLHYHRMRRARLRHRQDQDAFAAFITYHRDVRLMLPSYDEAINQQQHGRPPSYEEPTLPPEDTPAGEDPPSISTDSPTSSVSAASDTRSSPENNSDTGPLIDGQSSVSPTSEDSRFLRSLRTLFGGRPFRPDAIYCRFVPEENGCESSARTEERESRNNSNTVNDLTEVLAQAGLY